MEMIWTGRKVTAATICGPKCEVARGGSHNCTVITREPRELLWKFWARAEREEESITDPKLRS